MTLLEASNNIGNKVIYTPFEFCHYSLKESGVITSVNDRFVSVRYGSDVNSKSTRPEDLELEFKTIK
jgi:hypothetical protein